jgi:phosphohistidine phosphatase
MPTKKVLYIVRHAKSTWDYENISDIDRPLKLKGIRNAYEMARQLKINRNIPEFFIASPANRALHTACIFLNVFEASFDKLKIDPVLYGNGTEGVMQVIGSQPSNVKKLMIFGHNPDFSDLARNFVKEPLLEIPSGGVVILTFDTLNWSDIARENLKNEIFTFPKKE